MVYYHSRINVTILPSIVSLAKKWLMVDWVNQISWLIGWPSHKDGNFTRNGNHRSDSIVCAGVYFAFFFICSKVGKESSIIVVELGCL